MTLTEHALRGATIETGVVNRLRVGLPWYRSMPLSTLVEIELLLDGRPVPDIRLDIDGRALAVGELVTAVDRTWFLQDRQALTWSGDVPAADRAEVVLRMRLCLPNIVGPDGGALQVLQEARADLPVRARR